VPSRERIVSADCVVASLRSGVGDAIALPSFCSRLLLRHARCTDTRVSRAPLAPGDVHLRQQRARQWIGMAQILLPIQPVELNHLVVEVQHRQTSESDLMPATAGQRGVSYDSSAIG
jgi:hypothetical protein